MNDQPVPSRKGTWLEYMAGALSAVTLITAICLFATDDSGQFLAGLCKFLAELVVFVGNAVVLILNLLFWLFYGRQRRVLSTMAFQIVLAGAVGFHIYAQV
jgi:hypothetical protein